MAARTRYRGHVADSIHAGLGRDSALLRACPKCEAEPGHSCRHWVPGAGYFKPIARIHPERRRAKDPKN